MHLALTATLTLFLLALTDPLMVLMPSMAQMIALLLASVLLVVWAGLLMLETATDERETHHRMLADRNAYLVGIGLLTTGLLFQGFAHSIDSWVPLSLAGMIIAKALSRWYAERYL